MGVGANANPAIVILRLAEFAQQKCHLKYACESLLFSKCSLFVESCGTIVKGRVQKSVEQVM